MEAFMFWVVSASLSFIPIAILKFNNIEKKINDQNKVIKLLNINISTLYTAFKDTHPDIYLSKVEVKNMKEVEEWTDKIDLRLDDMNISKKLH